MSLASFGIFLVSVCWLLVCMCVLLIHTILMRFWNLCSIYYRSAEQHWYTCWSNNFDSKDSWRTGNTWIKELACTNTTWLLSSGWVLLYFTFFLFHTLHVSVCVCVHVICWIITLLVTISIHCWHKCFSHTWWWTLLMINLQRHYNLYWKYQFAY